jgi:hypothetical protein
MRRITVQSQPKKIVRKTLSRKKPSQKRAVRVTQGVGPEFKLQFRKKEKIKVSWARHDGLWFIPVIPSYLEAENRRIEVGG